jgi:hypothetical protein
MKQRLEPVVVHDAAAAADLRRDAVGALLDPAERFGIDRGTVASPLDDGVQVCQDLRVDAGGFGFGRADTVLSVECLVCQGEQILPPPRLFGALLVRGALFRMSHFARPLFARSFCALVSAAAMS